MNTFWRNMILALGLAALGAGCGGTREEIKEGKGPESPLPVEGAADSFNSPTEHGDLSFGVVSYASFTEQEGVHAWNFTLSDDADVQLKIGSSERNLDTVMYLYRRSPGAASWGAYVARNDDSEGKMTSALDKSLDDGEYRVLVKGYKRLSRGSFSLSASCSGAGCPAVQSCTSQMASTPAVTGLGASCVDKMQKVLTSPLISSNYTRVGKSQRCDQAELVRLAWDYYYSYFNDWGDIEDWFDEGEVTLNVTLKTFEEGFIVDLDMGGDEDGMTYLFDKNEELLAFYQSNQSPDYRYFCRDQGEPEQQEEVYSDYCLGHYLRNMSAPDSSGSSGSGTATLEDAEGTLSGFVTAAMKEHIARYGLGNDDVLDYSFVIWSGRDSEDLGQVTLSGGGKPETEYLMGHDWGNEYYIYSIMPAGGEAFFICK